MVLDSVTIAAFVAGTGILTREIVEEIKRKMWGIRGMYILALSILINTILVIGWAFWQHYELSVATVGAVLSFVVSVYYQEYKRNQKMIEDASRAQIQAQLQVK